MGYEFSLNVQFLERGFDVSATQLRRFGRQRGDGGRSTAVMRDGCSSSGSIVVAAAVGGGGEEAAVVVLRSVSTGLSVVYRRWLLADKR